MVVLGHLVLTLLIGTATVVTAEYLWPQGPRVEIYIGALAGFLLGTVGMGFNLLIWMRHSKASKAEVGEAPQDKLDVFSLWGLGFLTRLFLLGALSLVGWAYFEEDLAAVLLTMFAVYTGYLFWDAYWLYRKFTRQAD